MTWELIVERKGQSVLISSYFYNGIRTEYFKKILGIDAGFNQYLIVNYKNYYQTEDVKLWKACMRESIQKEGFQIIRKHLDILQKKAKDFLTFSEEIKGKGRRHLEKECQILFRKYSDLSLDFAPAMYYIIIESIIEEETKRIIETKIKENSNHYFSLLTQSSMPTEGTYELIRLYTIAEKYYNAKDKEEIKPLIKKHLKDFGWLSFTKFVGDPWTEKTIMERIKRIEKEKIRPQLLDLKTRYQKQKEETDRICMKFKFTKEEKEFIEIVQAIVWFRTFRIDVYTKAGFNVKNLFIFLAEKLGLSLEQFVFLTYKEIEENMSKKESFSVDLAERRKSGNWQLLFDHGTMNFQYEPPFLINENEKNNQSEVKGIVACKGIVQGEVCVIRGVKEFYKMKDDGILVTSMTTPDFVPIMERARAIVTDEGGITCHAAIVSREMKKPCIIGTKNATKVLKDGDFIEVDAEKGVVKKL